MFYKKYEDYLKEYLNKDISIKSVKPHEEKIFNEFQAKAILDSNSETLREEFHFVLDLISSRKEVNEEKTNDLKKSFERMIQGIDPSDYNALRFSIYKSRMMVLKENIRERETSSKEVPPTFTSNTSLQASDELVSPKLVAEQEKRFAEQATLNKRDNGKQEALSNEQIKENVATYVNLAHTTNQSTKEEQHQRPKVSDLKERFEKERSYNKEPHSAEVPSGTVNRLRQYYEGLNHSTNDHSPLESRKSSRWRTSQTNDSPNVQNRQNQPTDRQNQRNEGTSSYQKSPPLKGTSEFVRRGYERTVYTNESSPTNKAEPDQTGMTNEELQRRRDRFGNMPGPSNEPPVIKRTTQSEPYNYQTVAYQNPPRQQRSSELVHEGQTSRIDNNDSLRTNNVELNQTGRADEEFQNLFARFENQTSTSNEPSFSKKKSRGENEHQGTSYQRATTLHGSSEIVRKGNGSAVHTNDSASANETKSNQNDMTNEEFQNRRTRFENSSVKSDNHLASESTGRVRVARERFEKANVLRDERPVPESTGRVEAMRRQYESRTGRETEASDSNETFQQKQNGLANERFRQRQNQFENPAGTSSDGPKSEETVIADQLDRRKETSNQPTVHSADQTDITDIAAGNTKKIRELLADKLKFNPEEKVPSETNTQTNTQTDSSHASVEESSSDTQNSQMRNQMSEGGEPKPTKLDEASIATRGMDKKQSENITDPLDKLGIDASSSTLGLNENASEKTDKTTETDFMDDDIELPESGPHTQKKKIHTKKSRAIQIGRILLNLLPLASWPLISMWVTGILGIVPIYFAMYGLPLTLFIYGTVLAAFYGPKLINYIRKLRSRIQNYRQAERNRQRNLKDRVIDPKEKSIQRETAAHEKETAKTKKQDHASEKVGFENPEKDKSVKGYFKRNWKSFAIIIGVGLAVAGIGIALTPVVAPYIFAAATSTPLFMYKATSVIAMALAVSFGVTALSKGLHALQRKFYKKENQTLETTTQKETIEKNSLEVDKDFDKVYEKVDKDDRAPAHDNSSIESAGSKEDGIKLASNETKSMEKSPYAWVYGQETENKTQNESNRSSRTNSFNTHETLHVKEDIHEPPSQSLRENRATNQLGEAARYQVDNRKSESNPQIAEQNKGINRQPVVKEAFDSIKQKAISKSNNVSGKPLMKGQISFEK